MKCTCYLNAPPVFVSSFLYPECDILNSTETVLNSVVTLTCPLQPWTEVTQVIWEVLQGKRTERVGSITNCSSSCTTEANYNRAQRLLCKLRTVQDFQKGTGSLIISPVEITDAVWYRCTVQNKTRSYCSQVKIAVRGLFLRKLKSFWFSEIMFSCRT